MTAWLTPRGRAFRLSIIDSGGKRIPARFHDAGSQAVSIGKSRSLDDGIPFARTLKAIIVLPTPKISSGEAVGCIVMLGGEAGPQAVLPWTILTIGDLNGLELQEVGDFGDENCLISVNLIRSTKLSLTTELPISCRCCYRLFFCPSEVKQWQVCTHSVRREYISCDVVVFEVRHCKVHETH